MSFSHSYDDDFDLEIQGSCFGHIFDDKKDEHSNTPELLEISQRGSQLLLIAGNLKESVNQELNASFLGKSIFVGTGTTVQRFYSVWSYMNDYPVIIQEPTVGTPHKAKVYGEIYLVTPGQLAEIDYFEERGERTMRTKTQVKINKPFGIKNKSIEVFAHFHTCNLNEWKESMELGELTRTPIFYEKGNKTNQYYIWNPKANKKWLDKITY